MKKYTTLWRTSMSIRSLKTMIQCLLAMILVGYILNKIEWSYILTSGIVSGIFSIINSLSGLPESNTDGEFEIDLSDPSKDIYRLNLDCNPESLKTKKTVTFLVDTNASLSQK